MTSPSIPDSQPHHRSAEDGLQSGGDTDVRHDSESARFVAQVDGHEGVVDYQLRDGVMTITHTIVPAEIGGRGVAGQLNAAAMTYARQHGLKVSAQCSYTAAWLQRHPEWADLLV